MEVLDIITNNFNNREISLFFWSIILIIWALTSEKVRSSIVEVIKAFFQRAILIPVISMLVYNSLIIFLYNRIGLWKTIYLKDTIYWIIGVAFILLTNINKISTNEHFLKSIIIGNIKLIILIEFVVNLYVFNILIEFVLVPIIGVIGGMIAVAENKKEFSTVKRLLEYITMIIGIVILFHATYGIITNFHGFFSSNNLISFSLPIILTFSYLPFIYVFALYIEYSGLFTRIEFLNKNKPYVSTIKRKILLTCHFNLVRIKRLRRSLGLLRFENESDFLYAIQKFEDHGIN